MRNISKYHQSIKRGVHDNRQVISKYGLGIIILGIALGGLAITILLRNENNVPLVRQNIIDKWVKLEDQQAGTALLFVNPEKGDDSQTGLSKEAAYRTVQKALDKAVAGDVIELATGDYFQSIKTVRSGKKDKPITIRGDDKGIVSIRGDSKNNRVIEINHDYIIFMRLTVDGKTNQGTKKEDYKDKLIYAQGTQPKQGVKGVRLYKLLVKNAGGECIRFRYFAEQNEISNNTVENCGAYDFIFNQGGKNGEGIYIGTAPEQLADGKNPTKDRDVSANNWIHHNVIKTNATNA